MLNVLKIANEPDPLLDMGIDELVRWTIKGSYKYFIL
jgi:hypothetical protein